VPEREHDDEFEHEAGAHDQRHVQARFQLLVAHPEFALPELAEQRAVPHCPDEEEHDGPENHRQPVNVHVRASSRSLVALSRWPLASFASGCLSALPATI